MFKLWQKIIFSCYFIDSFSEIRLMKSKNCYYFAMILKDRFNGEIYYDVINGHFLTLIKYKLYD